MTQPSLFPVADPRPRGHEEETVTPYYQDELVTLYHGDCRDVLPTLPRVHAVVTDPPYGIDYGNGGGSSAKHGWARRIGAQWDKDRIPADLLAAVLAAGGDVVLWGGNYYTDALPFVPKGKWLVWDKGQTDFSLADCELAWCSWEGAIRRFSYARANALKDGKCHPTQKPQQVMAWTLSQLPQWDKVQMVLDPFAGSGTTLVEAKRLGRRAIGIERERSYCDEAVCRLKQGSLSAMFDVAEFVYCQHCRNTTRLATATKDETTGAYTCERCAA